MVKLTDEQAYKLSLYIEHNVNQSNDTHISKARDVMFYVLKHLTLPQIKQLAEQHNADVIEWVEFDSDDESTWSIDGSYVITKDINNVITFDVFLKIHNLIHNSYWANSTDVIKWTYLPTPKEK